MKKIIQLFLFGCLLFGMLPAQGKVRADLHPISDETTPESTTSTAVVLVEGLIQFHNARFVDHGLGLSEKEMHREFIRQQEDVILELKSRGLVQPVIVAGNDLLKKLILTFSAVVDESGDLIAILFEKTEYGNELDQAVLRLRPIRNLKAGEILMAKGEYPLLATRSGNMNAQSGGSLEIRFVTDMLKNQMDALVLQVVRGADGRWKLLDLETNKIVTKLYVDVGVKLTMNGFTGGVEAYFMDSRQNLPKKIHF